MHITEDHFGWADGQTEYIYQIHALYTQSIQVWGARLPPLVPEKVYGIEDPTSDSHGAEAMLQKSDSTDASDSSTWRRSTWSFEMDKQLPAFCMPRKAFIF